MTEFLDTEKLIIKMERRAALYNTHMLEYSDKHVKGKLWTEVCEAMKLIKTEK